MFKVLSKFAVVLISLVLMFSILFAQRVDATTLNTNKKFSISVPLGYRQEHIMNSAKTFVVRTNWYDATGKLVSILEYNPNTILDKNYLTKVRFQFYVKPDKTLIYARGLSAGQTTEIFEYLPNTKYGENSDGKRARFVFYVNPDLTIKFARGLTNGQVTEVFEYLPNTKYGENSDGKRARFVFYVNPDLTIKFAKGLTNGQVTEVFEYLPNTKYGENSDGKRARFVFYVNSDMTIRFAKGLSAGQTTEIFEYLPNTKYGENSDGKRGKFVFYVNSDLTIQFARGIVDGVATREYRYQPNTKWSEDGSHGFRLVSEVDLTKKYIFPVHADRWSISNPMNSGHLALDFQDKAYRPFNDGGPVLAVASGTVVVNGKYTDLDGNINGNWIIIDHGNGYTTYYGHLRYQSNLKVGTRVNQGDTIGEIGRTGDATGPHVHFELRKFGKSVTQEYCNSVGINCWITY